MKVPDVNLLLYATNDLSPLQPRILPWWEELMSGTEPVGFAWTVLLGFLRLSTRRQVAPNPFTPEEALTVVESWLARPNVIILQPTERHFSVLSGLIQEAGTAGNLTTDAHLAALAIEYGGEVCSGDNDFRRFRGLRYFNPLN